MANATTDLQVRFGDFAATTVAIDAVTAKGRAFMDAAVARGAVGCEVFKSTLPEWMARATAFGATWQ